jgi:hypothetical protein
MLTTDRLRHQSYSFPMHNLLDSDFIQIVFRRIGVKIRQRGTSYFIDIPVNFGHELD